MQGNNKAINHLISVLTSAAWKNCMDFCFSLLFSLAVDSWFYLSFQALSPLSAMILLCIYCMSAPKNKGLYWQGYPVSITRYSNSSFWFPLGVWQGKSILPLFILPLYSGFLLALPSLYREILITGDHCFYILILISRRTYVIGKILACLIIY